MATLVTLWAGVLSCHGCLFIVSTEAVYTMDLAWVLRRRLRHLLRRSVVRDFTITALAPTIFIYSVYIYRLFLLCHQRSWETYRDRSCDRRRSRRRRRRRRHPIFRLK